MRRFREVRSPPPGILRSVRFDVAGTFPGMPTSPAHAVLHIDASTFETEVASSTVPVLLDFATPWCQPCRVLEPILETIAREHGGRVKVARVDADANPDLATRFRVRGFPTVVAVVAGEERGRHVGVTNAKTLLALLDR